MEEKDGHLKFWEELALGVEGISGRKRYLNKLKRSFQEAEFRGEEVICLKEGPSYQKALEMVSADVEFVACLEKLKYAEERRKLKGMEFWLSVREESGLDEETGLIFDPINLKILRTVVKKQRDPASHKLSLDGYKELVMAALTNPLNASRMASDPTLSFPEIKRMAEFIIDGDFKPNLRKMIEEWMEDPIQAKESLPVLTEENMPGWLVRSSYLNKRITY